MLDPRTLAAEAAASGFELERLEKAARLLELTGALARHPFLGERLGLVSVRQRVERAACAARANALDTLSGYCLLRRQGLDWQCRRRKSAPGRVVGGSRLLGPISPALLARPLTAAAFAACSRRRMASRACRRCR